MEPKEKQGLKIKVAIQILKPARAQVTTYRIHGRKTWPSPTATEKYYFQITAYSYLEPCLLSRLYFLMKKPSMLETYVYRLILMKKLSSNRNGVPE